MKSAALADPRQARRRLGVVPLQRVLAAGVEEHQPAPAALGHRVDDGVERDGVLADVGGGAQDGVDRDQIIVLRELQPVAAVIEEGEVGVLGARRRNRRSPGSSAPDRDRPAATRRSRARAKPAATSRASLGGLASAGAD